MSDNFEDLPRVGFKGETQEMVHVLQAQLGLEAVQIINVAQGLGLAVLNMLVEAVPKGDGNPRVEINIFASNTTTSPVVDTAAQTLESIRSMATDHSE